MKPEEIINKLQSGGFKLDPSFIKLLSMVADEAMRYERQRCAQFIEAKGDEIADLFPTTFSTTWTKAIAKELRVKDNG